MSTTLCGRDVMVGPEKIGGVVLALDSLESGPGSAGVGSANVGLTFSGQEVDVYPAVLLL